MTQRRTDESTVDSHLGYSASKVVAIPVLIMGNPGGEELLQTRQSTGCEHLGSQRVGLKLLEVCLLNLRLWSAVRIQCIAGAEWTFATYRKVSSRPSGLGQGCADLMSEAFLLSALKSIGDA